MLKVEAIPGSRLAKVTPLTYWDNYNKGLRQVPGAKLNKEERPGKKDLWYWTIPTGCLDDLEAVFPDDQVSILYETPRWKLAGEAPPPLPTYMSMVTARQPKVFKLPLFPYQAYGASFMVTQARDNLQKRKIGYSLLADDMGLGKSPSALGAIELLMEDGEISRRPGEDMVLILGLSVAKMQWIRDTVQKFTDHPGLAIRTVSPAAREKLWMSWPNYKYISVNYELLLQEKDADFIFALPWKAIILDEPHQKLMGWEGKMHQTVKDLIAATKPSYVFMLSGTPVQADPDDLASLHDLVDPDLLGGAKAFNKNHVITEWNGSFAKAVAYKNMAKLRSLTEKHILRRTDQEVEVERPEGEPVNLDVDMTPLQKKLEEVIAKRRDELRTAAQEIDSLSKGNRDKEVFWKGQKQKAGDLLEMLDGAMQGTMAARIATAIDPSWLLDSESKWGQENLAPLVEKAMEGGKKIKAPKMELLLEELKQRVTVEGEKVVIFMTSLKGARRVYRTLMQEFGRGKLAYFVGGMSDNDRQEQIDRFMQDPDCMIMVANDAARSAVNMQVAKYMYHLDLCWHPTDYAQRVGRIKRVGSKHKTVHIFNLIATGSIDEDILAAWERKKMVSTSLIGVTEQQAQALNLAMSL